MERENSCGLVSPVLHNSLQIAFQKAREDESQRQSFLEMIDLEDKAEYISQVRYIPANNPKPKGVICCEPDICKFFNNYRTKSTISVFPLAFDSDTHENLDEFLSTFIDHEGYHAKQDYERCINPCLSILSAVFLFARVLPYAFVDRNTFESKFNFEKLKFHASDEASAIENQIINFQKRKVSDKYINLTNKRLLLYKLLLKNK